MPGLLSSPVRRRSVMTTIAGALAVLAVLAYVLADRRQEFATALGAAPVGILLVALVARTEAWHGCVALAYAAWALVDRLWAALRPVEVRA